MLAELSEIVTEVGRLLLKWRAAGRFGGRWEGPHQFKAHADLMAHEALARRLSRLAPTIPIISEENPDSWLKERPKRYWLIDPIDGTASFVGGFLGFVTQAALIKNGYPLVGAIYAPVLDLLYLAERGQGATLNGLPLHLSSDREPTILIDNYPEPQGVTLSAYEELNFLSYIECGSISLKICRVADGTADVFIKNVIVKDWDLAPAQLVLEEAGGVLRNVNGKRITYDGNYKQNGLVAVASQKACTRVVSWYKTFKKRK